MQTACVIPPPLGFVCSSPSHPTTQYLSQSPLQQTPQISSTPRNSRRRSAKNSVQLFLSSVIQYATDQTISPSSPLNPPSSSQVEFEKRDMASTTVQDCSHPQISLLSEMLRRQMIGGIGNCRDARIGGRGIQFDCGGNKSKTVFTPLNNNVSGRKCLKFGDCPSVVRMQQQQQQQRQSATILTNTNETVKTHMTPVKSIDNDGALISNGNGLTTAVTPFKKGKHLSPPPAKSLYLSKPVEASYEEEEEEKDDSDDEDGYLEDDEDEDDDDEEEEEEEDDDGEELTMSPSNLTSSFNSTRPNIKIQIHPVSIVGTTTSSEQEQTTTTTTTTSSHYSTALSILTSPNNVNRPIRKAKSLPYRVIPGNTTSNDTGDWHNEKEMPPLVRRRKLGVKSIPIPKTLNSHHFYEPCHNHKRRHGHRNNKNEDALWIDIISARRVRMAGAVDKSKEDKEEDVLWPLSI